MVASVVSASCVSCGDAEQRSFPKGRTLAVDHHQPLRALAALGFSDASAPFLAGAKLPSRKDSLHCSCFRSLSSARNARQIWSQTPCSSQSRSLRQHVAGEGNSSGKSCQRAPLRRIHKMPSSTLRSEARGRPPRRRERARGSKGRIFSHWASVNRRPYRAIGPPAALLTLFISHFRQPNYLRIQGLHPVLKQLLVSYLRYLLLIACTRNFTSVFAGCTTPSFTKGTKIQ